MKLVGPVKPVGLDKLGGLKKLVALSSSLASQCFLAL